MDLRALLLREGLHPKIQACASMEIVVRLALEGLAMADVHAERSRRYPNT